jgi:hypothetical protein
MPESRRLTNLVESAKFVEKRDFDLCSHQEEVELQMLFSNLVSYDGVTEPSLSHKLRFSWDKAFTEYRT